MSLFKINNDMPIINSINTFIQLIEIPALYRNLELFNVK